MGYYAVEGNLYILTKKQEKELQEKHPLDKKAYQQEEGWPERLSWIEMNGEFLGEVTLYQY